MNVGALLHRMNEHTKPFGVWNSIEHPSKGAKIEKGQVHFTGEWTPYCTRIPDINIRWIMHPHGHRVSMTPHTWRKWYFNYWTFLMHELVHRYQDQQRTDTSTARVFRPSAEKSELRDNQAYLGDYDEIEAHAHDVALEMFAWLPDESYAAAMRTMRSNPPFQSIATYPIYQKAFADTPGHPAMIVFHRKIRAWHKSMLQHRDVYATMNLHPYPNPHAHV